MTNTNNNATKTFEPCGVEELYRIASMYFKDIPSIGCCKYDTYYLGDRFAYETLSFHSLDFLEEVTVYATNNNIQFARFNSEHDLMSQAFVSKERLSSVLASRDAANPDPLPIYGMLRMHRIASAYYKGIPAMEDCEYRMTCFDDCPVTESISFYYSGFRVQVSVYNDGRIILFSELDSEGRVVRNDYLMPDKPDRMPFIAQAAGFPIGDAAAEKEAEETKPAPAAEKADPDVKEKEAEPLTAPLAHFTSLLDDFVEASITLRSFICPDPMEPAYLSACNVYSGLLYELISSTFLCRFRTQLEVEPKYLDEDHSSRYTIAKCGCGNIVRSLDDYCSKCGALLRWGCCYPA